MPDLTKLQFFSGNNYLKRSQFFDQIGIPVAGYAQWGQVSVTHNLGIIPQLITAIDYQNNGIWWSTGFVETQQMQGDGTTSGAGLIPSVDTNNLYFTTFNNGGATTLQVKYGLYLDS